MAELEMVETGLLVLDAPFGDEGDAQRAAGADRAMEELEDILAEPEYTGDAQTTLIHYMRRDAFDWYLADHLVKDFLKLEEKIAKAATEAPDDDLIPVVMSFQTVNGSSGNETALVAVDASEPHFRSSVEHNRGVQEQGFSGPLAVTERELALIGATIRVKGFDLAHHGVYWTEGQEAALDRVRYEYPDDEFVLHGTKLTSGRNSVNPPSDHGLKGGTKVTTDRFYSTQIPRVGWEEVTSAVSAGILDVIQGAKTAEGEDAYAQAYRYVDGVAEFFGKINMLEALLANSDKNLKKVFDEAAGLTSALGALMMAERPPQPSREDDW